MSNKIQSTPKITIENISNTNIDFTLQRVIQEEINKKNQIDLIYNHHIHDLKFENNFNTSDYFGSRSMHIPSEEDFNDLEDKLNFLINSEISGVNNKNILYTERKYENAIDFLCKYDA